MTRTMQPIAVFGFSQAIEMLGEQRPQRMRARRREPLLAGRLLQADERNQAAENDQPQREPQRVDTARSAESRNPATQRAERQQPARQRKPEPAHGRAQPLPRRGDGDPHQKSVGEQRIAEPAQAIHRHDHASSCPARRRAAGMPTSNTTQIARPIAITCRGPHRSDRAPGEPGRDRRP